MPLRPTPRPARRLAVGLALVVALTGCKDQTVTINLPPWERPPTAEVAPTPTPRPERPPSAAEPHAPNVSGLRAPGQDGQMALVLEAWTLVRDRYVDGGFNGADWAAAYTRTMQAVRAGLDDEGFHEQMLSLLDTLADGQSQYVPQPLVAAPPLTDTAPYVGLGFGFSYDVTDDFDAATIVQVQRGSPAERAGLRPHDRVLEINGEPSIDPALADLSDAFFDKGVLSATLKVQTPGAAVRTITLSKARITDTLQIDARLLGGRKRVGYLFLPGLADPSALPKLREALRGLMSGGALDGLIIDLRYAGGAERGADLAALPAMVGLFSAGPYGRFADRAGKGELLTALAENLGNSQKVPLVFLTGWRTGGAIEIAAGVLRAQKRARIVGQRTEGSNERVVVHTLSDGSQVWLAEQRFVLPDGRSWARDGLAPDIDVDAPWEGFSEADDPYLRAALDLLGR
ncbi:MAG: PDZ domain-containing protein [Thermoflexales bacterium]|nr:PDZ domain-containing protein [Thermoflexales bacterium]